MKLLFKQRFFSWFCSYDIYDESGQTVYVVKAKPAWGHLLIIYDAFGNEIGMVKQRVFTFLPKFEMYLNKQYIGCITKEFSLLKPKFTISYNGWHVKGDLLEWDYSIFSSTNQQIAAISKKIFNWTDTYELDIFNPQHAIYVLMLVLAIDAEKCSRTPA